MNQKTTFGLLIALLIAVVGLWWTKVSVESEPREAAAGPRPLFDPPLGDLAEFEIVQGGGGATIKFVMDKDKWTMTAPVAGPAEHYTVDTDAKKIAGLKFSRRYGPSDPDRPGDPLTRLDSPTRIVKLTAKSGKSAVVRIGARQQLSTKTYVRKEDDDAIYLIEDDLNQDLRRDLSDYRGKRVAEFTQTDAVRVEVTGQNHYTLGKSDGKWIIEAPVKARADATAVNNLLSGVANLYVQKFVDDQPRSLRPYGLDKPRLTVQVTTEKKTPKPTTQPTTAPEVQEYDIETQTIRLAFGGSGDDKVFGKLDDSLRPTVFQVAETSFKPLNVPLDDLRDKNVADLDTTRAQRISLTADGETVQLAKTGGVWEIVSGLAGTTTPQPAEFAAVDDLLRAVRELKATGFEQAPSPSLGLEQPRASIEITAEGQVEPVRLDVGGLTPSKTAAYVANRNEGSIAVVKAESVDALMAKPMSFLSRELLTFVRDRASKLELVFREWGCRVVKQAGRWRFAAPIEGNAEAGPVDAVINDLCNLRGRRVVGRSADAAKFGLDAPTVKVTVTVDPPPPPATQPTSQPEPAPAAEPTIHSLLVRRHDDGKVYAMVPGGQTICEVDGKVMDDLNAELFDTNVLSFDPIPVTRVAVEGQAPFTFEKIDENWKLAGEPTFAVDTGRLMDFLNALRDLRAKLYVRYTGAKLADYGLDKPDLVIRTRDRDGREKALMISDRGPTSGAGKYATSSAASDRVFVIKTEDLAKLNKSVKDFQRAS